MMDMTLVSVLKQLDSVYPQASVNDAAFVHSKDTHRPYFGQHNWHMDKGVFLDTVGLAWWYFDCHLLSLTLTLRVLQLRQP